MRKFLCSMSLSWIKNLDTRRFNNLILVTRDSEESKRSLHPVSQMPSSNVASQRSSSPRNTIREPLNTPAPSGPPVSIDSPTSIPSMASSNSRGGSNSSLRRKSSLARLRRLFKLWLRSLHTLNTSSPQNYIVLSPSLFYMTWDKVILGWRLVKSCPII